MKKDYQPVSLADFGLPESQLIERHWTDVWSTRQIPQITPGRGETREEQRLAEPYIAALPRGSRVLDGGCGLGGWTQYYSSRGLEVVGLDLSRETIDVVRQRLPQIAFVAGDIRSTEFPDSYFDAYFSWGTFEHFEEGLGAPLDEARRILKAGGYLILTVPYQNRRHLHRDRRPLHHWDRCFSETAGYTQRMRFYQWRLTEPELRRELEIHGFRTLKTTAMHKQQGLHRMIEYDLHVDPNTIPGKMLRRVLSPFVPASAVAHMIGAVGQNRKQSPDIQAAPAPRRLTSATTSSKTR
jgi:SAM-dependent methyltransferase